MKLVKGPLASAVMAMATAKGRYIRPDPSVLAPRTAWKYKGNWVRVNNLFHRCKEKWTAPYVVRNQPKSRKIAKDDETSKDNSPLTQHLQWDYAIVSSPVFHDKEYRKEHQGHCEQKDNSPIGPRVYHSPPLQGKYQTHSHWYLYAEAFQVEALQSSLAVEMCIFGSTEMIKTEEYYNNDSDTQRNNDVEADSPRWVMSYSSAD